MSGADHHAYLDAVRIHCVARKFEAGTQRLLVTSSCYNNERDCFSRDAVRDGNESSRHALGAGAHHFMAFLRLAIAQSCAPGSNQGGRSEQ
jgi:hypothetical protein